jgi:hypothetical protein
VGLLQAHEWLAQFEVDAIVGLDRPRKDLTRTHGRREIFQALLERDPAGSTWQNKRKKKNKVPESVHVGRFKTCGVKRSPEVRPKLSGIHTIIGKEKRFCDLGSCVPETLDPKKIKDGLP